MTLLMMLVVFVKGAVVCMYCNINSRSDFWHRFVAFSLFINSAVAPTARRLEDSCRKSKKNCGNDFIKPSHEVHHSVNGLV